MIMAIQWLGTARATTVIVPDDVPTIQAAIDSSGVTTIWVRPGRYTETPIVRSEVQILGMREPSPLGSGDGLATIPALVLEDLRAEHKGPEVTVRDLHIAGPVRCVMSGLLFSNRLMIYLSGCLIDSSICDTAQLARGQIGWEIGQSTIHGDVSIRYPEYLSIHDNVIRGRLSIASDNFYVDGNRIEGTAGRGLEVVRSSGGSDGEIGRNTILGFEDGIHLEGAQLNNMSIVGNFITDCPGTGILVHSESGINVIGNRIRSCRVGADLAGSGVQFQNNQIDSCDMAASVGQDYEYTNVIGNAVWTCGSGLTVHGSAPTVSGNVVLSCRGAGLTIYSETARVEGNVVGRCVQGLGVRTQDGGLLRGNTSFSNSDVGFWVDVSNEDEHMAIEHNLACGNGGAGLAVQVHLYPQEGSCNNWFDNAGGTFVGGYSSTGDLSVNPQFCDLAANDVHLHAGSPLLTGACGQIGALGAGCDPDTTTPTLVALFTAERSGDAVRIRWRLAEAFPGTIGLQRATASEGPWVEIETRSFSESNVDFVDLGAPADHPCWYRLVAYDRLEAHSIAEPIQVAAAEVRFQLARVAPNPMRTPLAIELVVASRAEIDLTVFDVQGREVASLARGVLDAGRHVVRWDPGEDHGPIPGVYLIRYAFPGGSQTRRLVVAE